VLEAESVTDLMEQHAGEVDACGDRPVGCDTPTPACSIKVENDRRPEGLGQLKPRQIGYFDRQCFE
jgi:hypothetical protein